MRVLRAAVAVHQSHVWASVFIAITGNIAFVKALLDIYSLSPRSLPFLVSVNLLFTLVTAFVLGLFAWGRATRWVLAVYLMAAAAAALFMDQYGTVIDSTMLTNLMQTQVAEAGDLITPTVVLRFVLLGVLPAALILKWPALRARAAQTLSWQRQVALRLVWLLLLVAGMLLCIAPLTPQYATFFREHKPVRALANPSYLTYSVIKWAHGEMRKGLPVVTQALAASAPDAQLHEDTLTHPHKELMILVVGETLRADRLALNGYHRPTTPLLAQQKVVSFKQVQSCGTSTAVSVPCMFSELGMAQFSQEAFAQRENALDVLTKNGVQVLWRDNNSDSKGVAVRMTYQDYKSPTLNTVCDDECRDEGMLVGLDDYIAQHKDKDLLIVLHMMGSHGPAYYKRVPPQFEKFKPVCKTSELSSCTSDEINNAYDNTVLYTDYFLNKVIDLLKRHDNHRETAMLYVSDHGESLGEGGLYLHGAPRAWAPAHQTHVPAIAWVGKHFDYKLSDLKPYENKPLSHDDLFCTLLTAFEIGAKQCGEGQPDQPKAQAAAPK